MKKPPAKFPTIPERVDPAMREQSVLELWRARSIFARSLEQTKNGPRYSFYEGPPTANGRPGVHHVLARAFKDLYPRFWTMRGYFVRRKAGWDTHGLPVEHEIEKELGILDKSRIEAEVGISEFTRRCRESVYRYINDWQQEGLTHQDGSQMVYSPDGGEVGVLEPGKGARFYDSESGKSMGTLAENQLPERNRPNVPAQLSLPQ